jgi:hypothetical protein
MSTQWKAAMFGAPATVTIGAATFAQTGYPPARGQAPLYDPLQLPIQRGQVQQFTLTPRGDIDGLILSDDTEVKTPPHLSTEMAYSIRPGDTVTIHGLRAAALPLVQAISITDEATGRAVVDNGPAGPGRGPGGPPGALLSGQSEVQGCLLMTLYGPRGDVNGALLEDGTILRRPPPEAERFTNLLQPDQALVAEGDGFATVLGKVFEVRELGPSRDQLSLVAEPPGRVANVAHHHPDGNQHGRGYDCAGRDLGDFGHCRRRRDRSAVAAAGGDLGGARCSDPGCVRFCPMA